MVRLVLTPVLYNLTERGRRYILLLSSSQIISDNSFQFNELLKMEERPTHFTIGEAGDFFSETGIPGNKNFLDWISIRTVWG